MPAATFRARIYLSRSWTPRGQREINNSALPVGITADHFRSFPSALISHPTGKGRGVGGGASARLLRTLFNRTMLMNTFPGRGTASHVESTTLPVVLKITRRNGYLLPRLSRTIFFPSTVPSSSLETLSRERGFYLIKVYSLNV